MRSHWADANRLISTQPQLTHVLHARTEAEWFEPLWQRAACILFLADRIHFHKPDGTRQPANSGAPPILAAFGEDAAQRLYRCGIAGALVTRWHNQPTLVLANPALGMAS